MGAVVGVAGYGAASLASTYYGSDATTFVVTATEVSQYHRCPLVGRAAPEESRGFEARLGYLFTGPFGPVVDCLGASVA